MTNGQRFFSVGKSDCTGEVFCFPTIAEAYAKLAEIEAVDPDGVHNGDYFVDAPEDWIGPGEEFAESED